MTVDAAAAPLHGVVLKTGVLNISLFHPDRQAACVADRDAWIARQAAAPAAAPNSTAHGGSCLERPPCQHCQVWANHRYRIVYVRHAKAGSTTVLGHFKDCREPNAPASCLERLFVSNSSIAGWSEVRVASMWCRYFIFTVARDPLERAVSTYHWLMRTVLPEPANCRSLVGWEAYCESPLSLTAVCVRRPECCYVPPPWFLLHHVEQAACLQAQGGRLAVDFVARTETFQDDLAQVVLKINELRQSGLPPLPQPAMSRENARQACGAGGRSVLLGGHSLALMYGRVGTPTWQGLLARERYCTTAEYYTGRHAHCAKGVAAYYAGDVALLGAGGPASRYSSA